MCVATAENQSATTITLRQYDVDRTCLGADRPLQGIVDHGTGSVPGRLGPDRLRPADRRPHSAGHGRHPATLTAHLLRRQVS